ncbi:putative invertase inhibitor [Malania oleifera]|uniref:putative invertase inhibitor n=1 Tax=Malania oleifera TaxID=397392 RepID=UPI0025AE90C4|nr:putative invertase inhibitor [Malania oleifera]
MNPNSSLITALLLLLLLVVPRHVSAATATDIAHACSKALYREFCISTLTSASGAKAADLPGLAKIALKLAKSSATQIKNHIHSLLASNSYPTLKSALSDCRQQFQDASGELDESLAAFGFKHYNDVSVSVSAAMSNADSCTQGFKDIKAESPIDAENDKFNKLCSSALGITNVVAG